MIFGWSVKYRYCIFWKVAVFSPNRYPFEICAHYRTYRMQKILKNLFESNVFLIFTRAVKAPKVNNWVHMLSSLKIRNFLARADVYLKFAHPIEEILGSLNSLEFHIILIFAQPVKSERGSNISNFILKNSLEFYVLLIIARSVKTGSLPRSMSTETLL